MNQKTNENNMEESSSTQYSQNESIKDKDKDVYFLVLRPSEEKIDFTGLNYETKNKIVPQIIFQERIDREDKTYLEEIVFKFKKKRKKLQIKRQNMQ